MIVKVVSNIPYLQDLNGEHQLEEGVMVKTFLQSIGVKWNIDALVVLNGKICNGEERLNHQDLIELLVPLSGG